MSLVNSHSPKTNQTFSFSDTEYGGSADNSDEDVNDDAAVSARDGAGVAGAEGNSCVGEVIDSDSSSRKSEVRLVS